MKGDTVTIILLFALIIGISLWISQKSSHVRSQSSILPYSPYNSKYSSYEGYHNYSDTHTMKQIDDSKQLIEKQNSICSQLNGWKGNGIFCSPNNTKLDQIDIYSHAKGDLNCTKSSGYHNSKGGLCLDQHMIQLLQTRGMNATGGYGQIGTGSA